MIWLRRLIDAFMGRAEGVASRHGDAYGDGRGLFPALRAAGKEAADWAGRADRSARRAQAHPR